MGAIEDQTRYRIGEASRIAELNGMLLRQGSSVDPGGGPDAAKVTQVWEREYGDWGPKDEEFTSRRLKTNRNARFLPVPPPDTVSAPFLINTESEVSPTSSIPSIQEESAPSFDSTYQSRDAFSSDDDSRRGRSRSRSDSRRRPDPYESDEPSDDETYYSRHSSHSRRSDYPSRARVRSSSRPRGRRPGYR
jgi:hypothetical protein